MITKRSIFVTFQREGLHRYPDAPEAVSFLRNPHRHVFWFEVEIEVFHNDRCLEFILVKRELEALYENKLLDLDYKSCEMLAEDLINYLSNVYPNRKINVRISEDNENGAYLEFVPE